MSSSKQIWPVKGLFGRCLSEFIDWRYGQSCWFFRPSFVNCCPSNLLSGLISPLSPFPVWISILGNVYTYTVCKGGVWGSGPQTDKHLPAAKSLYRSIFLDDGIFLHCLLSSLIFLYELYHLCFLQVALHPQSLLTTFDCFSDDDF
jgi:hypothetical protein